MILTLYILKKAIENGTYYISEIPRCYNTYMNMPATLLTDLAFYKLYVCDNTSNDIVNIISIELIYIRLKRIKNILNRFIYNYKIKKSIKYLEKDLFFNDLNDYRKKHIVKIYQNKTLYSFRINDIINIWRDCLIKSENLFNTPIELKNPYTNIIFKKHNLYNIFISILNSGYIIPSLLQSLFYCNFRLHKFSYENYEKLKDIAIESFMMEGAIYEKMEHINNMLHENKRIVRYVRVSDALNYRDRKQVTIDLHKLLRLYLISEYSCHPIKKTNSALSLKKELKLHFEKIDNSKDYYDIPEPVVYSRINRLRQYRRATVLNPMRDRLEDARDISLNLSESPTVNTIINPFRPRRQLPRSPSSGIPELRLNVEEGEEEEIPLVVRERRLLPPPPPPPPPIVLPTINQENNDISNNINNNNDTNRVSPPQQLSPNQIRQLRFRTMRRL
tara:strand:- start:4363 stop:5700 length:1338 start_codon:yes stop_codon:yes gene_type:complete